MDWYPWYYTLYESDTMHLSPYQDGCYRRLIDHYMKTRQALPDSEAALARIVGDSEANWVAMASPLVRPFFTSRNGRLFHKKCESILADQDQRAKKLSESGKNGAKKRWNNINDENSHPIGEANGLPIATLKPVNSTLQDTTGQEVSKNPPKPPRGGRRSAVVDHPDFAAWYAHYPHKVARQAAVRAFHPARAKTSLAELQAGLERYKRDKPPDVPWCNPATWLNAERWKDEPAGSSAKPLTAAEIAANQKADELLGGFEK